jgi:hypothetical protein
MMLRPLCSLTALLGVMFLGTPALDKKIVPAAGPSRERLISQGVPAPAAPLEEEDPQLTECEREAIGWSYSAWRKALVRRMTILSLSPRPAHYEAGYLLRRVVEWEEENNVEQVVEYPPRRALVWEGSRRVDDSALWEHAARASRLLGQLRERVKDPLFCVASVPGDRGHDWVVDNARQLWATLEDLDKRQRALANQLKEREERLRRLYEEVTKRLFEELGAEEGNNGANKP